METAAGKKTINVLRRLIAYSEKIFQFSRDIIAPISDRRTEPRISTAAVVKSATVLFWARMGSINAWEQLGRSPFWRRWLGEPACSADSLGRVHALLDADGLRQGIHLVYERLKRNKALPDIHGLGVVVLDGHESHASYLRHCPGCLERTIHGEKGDRIQYYHRQVTLMLLPAARPKGQAVRLLLDQSGSYRSPQCSWWDFPNLISWPQVHVPVRVIRSLENYSIRRQSDQQEEPQSSDWIWVTTLSAAQVPVGRVVHLGHPRWDIENYAFNELVNEWHSDHVFKHNSEAIECFLLVTFLAYDIFHAFLALNIKPAARQGKTQVFWAKLIGAELYSEVTPASLSP